MEEKIVCCAVCYKIEGVDIIDKESIVIGVNNFACKAILKHIIKTNTDFFTEVCEGFFTNKNRFVLPEEAAIIAYHAGQILEPVKYLMMEDLSD